MCKGFLPKIRLFPKALRYSLKKGERITTIGGLVGRIVQVNDATVVFETSEDRVRIEVAKWGIQSAESMEQAAAPKAKKADKAEKKAEEKPQTEEEAKTVALPIEDKAEKAEKAEKSEDKPSYDPEIK